MSSWSLDYRVTYFMSGHFFSQYTEVEHSKSSASASYIHLVVLFSFVSLTKQVSLEFYIIHHNFEIAFNTLIKYLFKEISENMNSRI